MRLGRGRKTDAAYELNLAPLLDIIVSVIPMLLLSVVFVQIKMIETSVPQIVAKKIQEQREEKKPELSLALKVSGQTGFNFVLNNNGKTEEFKVALKNQKLDFDSLTKMAIDLKKQYVDLFSVDLLPEGAVPYNELVQTMDSIRRLPSSEGKLTVTDKKTGEKAQTDLMFPDVVFANVVE